MRRRGGTSSRGTTFGHGARGELQRFRLSYGADSLREPGGRPEGPLQSDREVPADGIRHARVGPDSRRTGGTTRRVTRRGRHGRSAHEGTGVQAPVSMHTPAMAKCFGHSFDMGSIGGHGSRDEGGGACDISTDAGGRGGMSVVSRPLDMDGMGVHGSSKAGGLGDYISIVACGMGVMRDYSHSLGMGGMAGHRSIDEGSMSSDISSVVSGTCGMSASVHSRGMEGMGRHDSMDDVGIGNGISIVSCSGSTGEGGMDGQRHRQCRMWYWRCGRVLAAARHGRHGRTFGWASHASFRWSPALLSASGGDVRLAVYALEHDGLWIGLPLGGFANRWRDPVREFRIEDVVLLDSGRPASSTTSSTVGGLAGVSV